MLKIKLFPKGKKHQRTFRIVVAEARSKYNGNVVDDLGFFTPQTKTLQVDKDKIAQWVKNGAQITLGVNRLLDPAKFPKKVKPVKPPKPVTETKPEEKVEAVKEPEVKVETEAKVEPEVKVEAPAL
jgi:small subunit ribosomal protein S16